MAGKLGEKDLERLFPASSRQEIFASALRQVLANEQIKESQLQLSKLKDPPDLKAIAMDQADDAWKRVSGEVEKHLQLLQVRENRVKELRETMPPPPADPEFDANYKQVADKLDRADAYVYRLQGFVDRLRNRQDQIIAFQQANLVKQSLAELADQLYADGLVMEEERPRSKPDKSAGAGRQATSAKSSPDSAEKSRIALQAKLAVLGTGEKQLDEQLKETRALYEKKRQELTAAQRARGDIQGSLARLNQQRNQYSSQHLSGLFQADPELSHLDDVIRESSTALTSSLAQHGIAPIIIRAINKAQGRIYATAVSLRRLASWAQVSDIDNRHPTKAWRAVEKLIGSAPSLSIGISGPRGAGKTTLIDWVCTGRGILDRPSGLGITVPAPSNYAPREFLLFLYSELCERVLTFIRLPASNSIFLERQSLWVRRLAYAVAAISVITVGIASYVAFQWRDATASALENLIVTCIAIAATVAASRFSFINARRICREVALDPESASVVLTRKRAGLMETERLRRESYDDDDAQRTVTPRGRLRLLRYRFSSRRRLPGTAQVRQATDSSILLNHSILSLVLAVTVGLGVIVALKPIINNRLEPRLLISVILFSGLVAVNTIADKLVGYVIAPAIPDGRPQRHLVADGTASRSTDAFTIEARIISATMLRDLVRWVSVLIVIWTLAGIFLIKPHDGRVFITAFIGLVALLSFVYLLELRLHLASVRPNVRTVDHSEELIEMAKSARDGLEIVQYQLSFTRGWSAGITSSLPVGIEAQRSAEQTSQRLEITLPELISRFRLLAEKFAARANPLIFGIDELDKISSAEDAKSFLNSIKGVLGVPNCYFLVSMSDDAFADFERRGIPFRSAFDSCFDDVVYVGYVSFEVAREILDDNIIGMSIPFQGLCYTLAGGLPRELIRYTRQLQYVQSDITYLDKVACQLFEAEIKSQIDAALIGIRGTQEGDAQQDTLTICRTLRVIPIQADKLYSFCREFVDESSYTRNAGYPKRRAAGVRNTHLGGGTAQVGRELVAFAYFGSTVLSFFRKDLSRTEIKMAEGPGDGSFDQLANARKAFSSGPAAVWYEVNAFRKAKDMQTLPYPFWHRGRGPRPQ